MPQVIRARFENGVLRPLDRLDIEEGREVKIIIMDESFYDLVEKLEIEAKENIDKILAEVRERGRSVSPLTVFLITFR